MMLMEELIEEVASSVELEQQYERVKKNAYCAKERRREQCRMSQKTFRERKKREHQHIELTVQALEKEVQELEVKRAELVRYVPLQHILTHQPNFDGGVPTKLVRKYINVFKNGYTPSRRRISEKQERFLTSIAHDEINYNGQIGVKSILFNWERYTSSFTAVYMEPLSCDLVKTDDGAIVRGRTKSTLKISRQSIARFFPNCPEVLKPRLIGQTLEVIATMHWAFDDTDKLVQLTGRADFTSGLLAILRRPEDVAAVLSQSRIIPPAINSS